MTEELALEEVLWDRPAVDGDEGASAPWGELVEGSNDGSLPAPLSPMISAFAWLSAIRSTLSKSGTKGECGA